MEKIIDRYKLKNIHEMWPNLGVYVHGGVAMEPYKKGFEKVHVLVEPYDSFKDEGKLHIQKGSGNFVPI